MFICCFYIIESWFIHWVTCKAICIFSVYWRNYVSVCECSYWCLDCVQFLQCSHMNRCELKSVNDWTHAKSKIYGTMINHIELIAFCCRWNKQKMHLSYMAADLRSRGTRFESLPDIKYPVTIHRFSQIPQQLPVHIDLKFKGKGLCMKGLPK
jgi:hypothetical protein